MHATSNLRVRRKSLSFLFLLVFVNESSFAWSIHPICKRYESPARTAFLFGDRLGFLDASSIVRKSTIVENIAIQDIGVGIKIVVDLVKFEIKDGEIISVITIRNIAPFDPDSRECHISGVRVFINSQEFDESSLRSQ